MARHVRLSARNLRVEYSGLTALDIPQLEVSGNIIGVVGHNGAGKSTFIKALLEVLKPTAGQLEVSEHLGGSETRLRPDEHMALCPETGSVFLDISVEEYIKLWCRFKQKSNRYYLQDGAWIMEALNVTQLFKKRGCELSKGQRRRVQTAIGFLMNPRFFLYDEPFDGLDVQKSNELVEIMQSRASAMSFLVSSHRMDVVERLADYLIVLRSGTVFAAGTVDEVVRALSGESTVITSMCDSDQVFRVLKDTFPQALVSRIGNQVAVTGGGVDVVDLEQLVRSHDRNGVQFHRSRPSLTDAMNFHLRSLPSGADA
jgi:ABC-2 type transport system ATP-binding protein